MRAITYGLLTVALLALAACGGGPRVSKFKSYDGPKVTQLYISKTDRRLYLIHDKTVVKAYDVGLGFAPDGHKFKSGDGRTPEGLYYIDRRNPRSRYHLSIGISYPNVRDVQVARAAGVKPGGDIFIHGEDRNPKFGDWTAGCIAVTNEEIEEIYAMVGKGTPIYIAR